jgi:Uma2 family endonuclease
MGGRSMTVTPLKITFEDFLNHEDDRESLYELEDGELIPMPAESEINRRIAMFLAIHFSKLGIPSYRLTMKTEVATCGTRVSVRVPDLVILSEEGAAILKGATRSIILMDMPPPLLVVEVVSPNQEKRDYRYKRSEYAARGIAEYWIVDPIQARVTVLEWVEGLYEEQVYTGDMQIISPLLDHLELTANQTLAG